MTQTSQQSSITLGVYPNTIAIGTSLPGTDDGNGTTGLTVTGFQFDGQSATLSSDSDNATLTGDAGSFFSVNITGSGTVYIALTAGSNNQNLIDAIDSGSPLSIPVTYEVSDGNSTVTDTLNIIPVDLDIYAPAAVTVGEGQTTLLTGMSVQVPAPSGNPGFDPNLTVSVTDANQLGTLGFNTGLTNLQSSVQQIADGYTLTGTESQINADLADMTYTGGSAAGTDGVNITATQTGSGGTVLQQASEYAINSPAITVASNGISISPPSPLAGLPSHTTVAITGLQVTATPPSGVSDPQLSVTVSDGNGLDTLGFPGTYATASDVSSTPPGGLASTLTLTGTQSEIDQDLSQLTYTSGSSTGADSLNIGVTEYAADGITVFNQANATDPLVLNIPPVSYTYDVDAPEGTSLFYTSSFPAGAPTPGDVTAVSINGGTPVPAGTTVVGNYFSVDVAADGSVSFSPAADTQTLINEINGNTSGVPLADDLTYTVASGSGGASSSYTVALDATDIAVQAPTTALQVGQQIDLSSLQVSIPSSTDSLGNPILAPSPTVSVQVDDWLGDGTLAFTGSAAAGSTAAPDTNYGQGFLFTGSLAAVNEDLAQLKFTGTNAGTDGLVVDVIEQNTAGAGGIVQETGVVVQGQLEIAAACFRTGTRILTSRGEIRIEDLVPGDAVVVVRESGCITRPVVWTGHRRIDCARYADPSAVWPVLIRAGAFGEQQPSRDLYVSPGHSVHVEGVLTQIENLINGTTVLQVALDTVEYWHVELDAHDVLLAEGLPTESYLDTGNRAAFIGGGEFLELHPDFRPKHWSQTCVPLLAEGPEVDRARHGLLERAPALGFRITRENDLHVRADGERVEGVRLGGSRMAFLLPVACGDVQLVSRTFVPAQTTAGNRDRRTLGVCVGRLQLDGIEVALDDSALITDGWHGLESRRDGSQRWTCGGAKLPGGVRLVVLELVGEGYYWQEARPWLEVVTGT